MHVHIRSALDSLIKCETQAELEEDVVQEVPVCKTVLLALGDVDVYASFRWIGEQAAHISSDVTEFSLQVVFVETRRLSARRSKGGNIRVIRLFLLLLQIPRGVWGARGPGAASRPGHDSGAVAVRTTMNLSDEQPVLVVLTMKAWTGGRLDPSPSPSLYPWRGGHPSPSSSDRRWMNVLHEQVRLDSPERPPHSLPDEA